MALFRIIYASKARPGLGMTDIESILEACEKNNARSFVTGMLLFDNGHFMQSLEGERSAVCERFLKIAQDPRHHGVEILVGGPIEARLFQDWTMHHVTVHGEGARVLRRYQGRACFDPYAMSATAAEQLCLDYAAQASSSRMAALLRSA